MENTKFNISILYVEDEEDARKAVSEMISWRIRNFYLAENAAKALEIFKSQKVDLLLSDIKMPGMNGLEMAEKMKELNPQLRIIMMSAFTDTNYLLKSIDLQVDGYIVKPVRIKKLLSAIKKQTDIIISDQIIRDQEHKIQKSQKILKEAQKIAKLGYWELDIINNKLIWSDEIYRIFNLKPQKFAATYEAFLDQIHPDDRAKVNDAYTNSLKTKKAYEIEHRVLSKTGELKYVLEKCKTDYNDKGKPTRSIGTLQDITKQVENETALKESEERYKSLFKESYSIMLIIDPVKGQIVDANRAASTFYGYAHHEIIQMNIKQINVLSEDEIYHEMQNAKKNERNSFFFKHKLSNNELRDVEVYSGKIRIEKKYLLCSIIHDITTQRNAELKIQEQNKELIELNATKDKFFSIIAHDLKSPFSTMLGFSKLLIDNFEQYDKEKQKNFLGIINKDIQKTYRLLENLLLWSSTQRGKINYFPEKVKLNMLTVEIVELLKQTAVSKSITIKNEIAENIIINADQNMLLTILRNLISNAIKFTHKEGKIVISAHLISAENKQNFIEIAVKDSGVGIEKEKWANLFKIAENISTKGTEGESGTGLGLILCKEFVEKHGGKIWVESELNKGSTFIFTLKTN